MLLFLVTLGLSACSFTATPPADLLDRNDHVALAAWYDNDAARLRQKAKEMEQMVEEYQRNPEQAQQRMSHGSPKRRSDADGRAIDLASSNESRPSMKVVPVTPCA